MVGYYHRKTVTTRYPQLSFVLTRHTGMCWRVVAKNVSFLVDALHFFIFLFDGIILKFSFTFFSLLDCKDLEPPFEKPISPIIRSPIQVFNGFTNTCYHIEKRLVLILPASHRFAIGRQS